MWAKIRNALAILGGLLLAALTFGALGRRERPMADEVDSAIDQARDAAEGAADVADEERQKMEQRQEQHKALGERLRGLDKRRKMLPVVLLLAAGLALAAPASAQDLPGDYEQLSDLYLEAVDVARQYRDLYEAAEASNARLLSELDALRQQVEALTATVERQQALIERQQQSILGLLGGLSLEAGVEADGLSPITLTPFLRVAYRF